MRQRLARVWVFDPTCGSGNFLVIASKEMRAIEAAINQRRGEPNRKSDIPLTNFRGIEIRHFATEIARLALIIAEYQCDVLYRGPQLAKPKSILRMKAAKPTSAETHPTLEQNIKVKNTKLNCGLFHSK